MTYPLRTVILNGSPQRPSRTQVLLNALHERLKQSIPLETSFIELADMIPHIGTALSLDGLAQPAREAFQRIEDADLLIVGAPVYRGSVPGLFKHLLDLLDLNALRGKPVLLAATGGSPRHSLVIDHQLRPLFGFFQAQTLPIGVYATPEDIKNGKIVSSALADHIELSIELALPAAASLSRVRAHQADQFRAVA